MATDKKACVLCCHRFGSRTCSRIFIHEPSEQDFLKSQWFVNQTKILNYEEANNVSNFRKRNLL